MRVGAQVYLVTGGSYEQYTVYAAYSTEEAARTRAAKMSELTLDEYAEVERLYCRVPGDVARLEAASAPRRIRRAFEAGPCVVEVFDLDTGDPVAAPE